MLDLSATDAVRAKIVADTRATIEASGRLIGDHDWGARNLAYEIRHREQSEYRLLQFEGPPSLPAGLARTLRITDGVLRHRIIKLEGPPPTQPPTPAPEPPALATTPAQAPQAAAPVEPAAETAPVEPEAAAAAPDEAPAAAADQPVAPPPDPDAPAPASA